ncbi:Hypothetical predicted protein [Octopus vulgaris]|uniref:Uncharacterized protein n=1 Tax=Octopus vulgaris TaxID=6645 RepID=A0AA36BSN4_OCTVU|nr:Hypothetical predicted protein [Octopus vulgaris]
MSLLCVCVKKARLIGNADILDLLTTGVQGNLKMTITPQQCSWFVLGFPRSNSVVAMECAFRLKYQAIPAALESIQKWYNDFSQKGCICDQRKGHCDRDIYLRRSY